MLNKSTKQARRTSFIFVKRFKALSHKSLKHQSIKEKGHPPRERRRFRQATISIQAPKIERVEFRVDKHQLAYDKN
ncbi:MAG: hypothetical protein ACJAYF_001955 [Arenicella sp.]|jgi:hypothetical protein